MRRRETPFATAVSFAVASAVAFGVTAPLIARVGRDTRPLVTAALLYLGASGLSLLLRPFTARSGRALARSDTPRLLVIGVFGAALAPVLLVVGLARSDATSASLVLNFEAAFTALAAFWLYREGLSRRVLGALGVMTLGGALVALDGSGSVHPGRVLGLLFVLAATLGWALDNVLTRPLSQADPGDVVAAKGLVGATLTSLLALAWHEPLPSRAAALALLGVGATGYGLSLRLYLLAQRRMGAARTASVFACGPCVGALFAVALGDRTGGAGTALGALAFGAGVYLHATEGHAHRHFHPALEHDHLHAHDDGHHDHAHDPPVTGEHRHPHRHPALEHDHAHGHDDDHGHAH